MELLIVAVVLAFVVGLVALVGHGLWLLLAGIVELMFGSPAPPPRPDRPRRFRDTCPGCRGQLLSFHRDCPQCNLPLDSRLAERLDRVRLAEREVLGLADCGEFDPAIAQQVATRLDKVARDLLISSNYQPGTHFAHPQANPAPERAQPIALAALTLGEPFALHGQAPEDPTPGRLRVAARQDDTEQIPVLEPDPTPGRLRVAARRDDTEKIPEPEPELIVEAREPQRQGGMLAGFMEERNILWGELVGGLLIVGCSIALVLTLWRSLEALPYFPFLLATGITAALYGAGQYTLHHWKLAATSRGLLVISLLLTPLNLLLLAGPGSDAAGGLLDIAVKAAAVLLFVGMVRGAGRDLIGVHLLPGPLDRRWLLALAVVGTPASQILFGAAGSFLPPWLALVCYTVACGAVLGGLTWYLPRSERQASSPVAPRPEDPPRNERIELSERQGAAVLIFVGISLIALCAAWGLVLTRSPNLTAALAGLAFPLALAAVPVTEAGILVQRRSPGDPGMKATGTGVALTGSLLLAIGATLAWPDPVRLLLVAALAGVLFTRVAWRESLPWFQIGAIPALGLAAVLTTHGIAGHWTVPPGASPGPWLRGTLDSPLSGIVLAGFGLLLAALAEWFVRIGNRAQGVAYALGGAALGAIALFIVSVHGVEEPWPAAVVHAVGVVGLLAANVRWRQRAVAEVGCWLALVGTLWFLWASAPNQQAGWGFVFALESLVLAATALALARRAVRIGSAGAILGQLRHATANVAVAAGVIAVALTVFTPSFPHGWMAAAAFLTLAAAGLMLTRVFANPWPTWLGAAAALAGLVLLTTSVCEVRPTSAALLLALLGHATLALAGTWLLHGKPSRNRLFAEPLRQSARITTILAAPILLFPAAGLAPQWAGFAMWLAAVWFVLAWVWREVGAFSAAQGALTAAVVLGGLGWVEPPRVVETGRARVIRPASAANAWGWPGNARPRVGSNPPGCCAD